MVVDVVNVDVDVLGGIVVDVSLSLVRGRDWLSTLLLRLGVAVWGLSTLLEKAYGDADSARLRYLEVTGHNTRGKQNGIHADENLCCKGGTRP